MKDAPPIPAQQIKYIGNLKNQGNLKWWKELINNTPAVLV
jgi:hypothetical protein